MTEQTQIHDYSSLSQLAECARKAYYAQERNLASEEVVPVLKAGTALHKGLEILYKSDWNVDEAADALHDSWGSYRVPPAHDHSFLGPGYLETILRDYADNYRNEAFESVISGGELFGERAFQVSWKGADSEDVTLGGIIDLLQRRQDGRLALVDFKTTTAKVNKWWARRRAFAIDHQLKLYALAVEQELDELPAVYYIRGIYMGEWQPKNGWDSVKSVPVNEFGPFQLTPARLRESKAWAEVLQDELEWRRAQQEKFEREEYAWPQNPKNRYACDKCDFYDLCTASPPRREAAIKKDYVEKEPEGKLLSGADE